MIYIFTHNHGSGTIIKLYDFSLSYKDMAKVLKWLAKKRLVVYIAHACHTGTYIKKIKNELSSMGVTLKNTVMVSCTGSG